MTRILIDTDPGQDIDDLLAILFALRRPELQVLAITTATWPSAGRARLVRRLLRHLGRDDIPAAPGMQLPLRRMDPAELASQHDPARTMNHACFAEPADPRDEAAGDAVELIIRTVLASPEPVVLCCIAPLTNIACALRREPRIAGNIRAIALMGGEVALNRREHNIAFDPVAADIVVNAGVPVAMGTWDVTRRVVLGDADCARFAASGHELHRGIARAIAAWHPAQSWKPGPVMYDLFPMVWAFDRSYYRTETMQVRIETSGDACGMTIPGAGAAIEVTTGLREDDLRELYLRTVFG